MDGETQRSLISAVFADDQSLGELNKRWKVRNILKRSGCHDSESQEGIREHFLAKQSQAARMAPVSALTVERVLGTTCHLLEGPKA